MVGRLSRACACWPAHGRDGTHGHTCSTTGIDRPRHCAMLLTCVSLPAACRQVLTRSKGQQTNCELYPVTVGKIYRPLAFKAAARESASDGASLQRNYLMRCDPAFGIPLSFTFVSAEHFDIADAD